jgi:tetratricopeptide (TPR) repeat protein
MEASTPDYDEDTILELLEEALGSGMLTEEGTGTRITYQFWHPLLATHLYEHLSAARRANLHRKAAEVMRQLYKHHEEEYAAVILNHLVNGGADEEQIAYYAELAGNRDCELSSFLEAEKHYRIALDNLGMKYHDWARLSFLLERLGEIARSKGEFDEARKMYGIALDVSLKHGGKESAQYQQEAQVIVMLLYEIGATWYSQGNLVQARDYTQRAMQVVKEAGVTTGMVWAKIRLIQSYVSWREGNYNEARQTANKALEMFNSLVQEQKSIELTSYLSLEKRALTNDSIDISRMYFLLGNTEAASGRCSDALVLMNKALAIAEQYNSQREIALICTNMGDLYLRTANYSQSQVYLRRAKSIAELIEDKAVYSIVMCNMGILDLRSGNLKEALDELKEAIVIAESNKDYASVSVCRSYLAVALLESTDLNAAKEALYLALNISRKLSLFPYIGLSLIYIGYLRLKQSMNEKKDLNMRSKSLLRAQKALSHAISIDGIEEETRIEGRLILAQVLLCRHELDEALDQTIQALQQATQLELAWLVARAYHVLGNIFVVKQDYDNARSNYERALQITKKGEIKLEMARILQNLGDLLVKNFSTNFEDQHIAQSYLKEAEAIFMECNIAKASPEEIAGIS